MVHVEKFELNNEQLERLAWLEENEPETNLVVFPVMLTKAKYDQLIEKVKELNLVEDYDGNEHELVVGALEESLALLEVERRLKLWKERWKEQQGKRI